MDNRMLAFLYVNFVNCSPGDNMSIFVRLFLEPASFPEEDCEQVVQALVGLLEDHRRSK